MAEIEEGEASLNLKDHDTNQPNYKTELSIFLKETLTKIEAFRSARSLWIEGSSKDNVKQKNVLEGQYTSQYYQGRCICLRKIGFKTTRLRNHHRTLRPLKYYTLKQKLSDSESSESNSEDDHENCILPDAVRLVVAPRQRQSANVIFNIGTQISKIWSKTQHEDKGQNGKETKKKSKKMKKTKAAKCQEKRNHDQEKKAHKGSDERTRESSEKSRKKAEKEKAKCATQKPQKPQKPQKQQPKENEKVNKNGISRRIIENLKSGKETSKAMPPCICDNGKEVTVIIKGYCLCDKGNPNKLTSEKVCGEYCRSQIAKASQLSEAHLTDSLEVLRKRLRLKSARQEFLEIPEDFENDSLTEKTKCLEITSLEHVIETKEPCEQRKEEKQEIANDSLVVLFRNKERVQSQMAFTKQQLEEMKKACKK